MLLNQLSLTLRNIIWRCDSLPPNLVKIPLSIGSWSTYGKHCLGCERAHEKKHNGWYLLVSQTLLRDQGRSSQSPQYLAFHDKILNQNSVFEFICSLPPKEEPSEPWAATSMATDDCLGETPEDGIGRLTNYPRIASKHNPHLILVETAVWDKYFSSLQIYTLETVRASLLLQCCWV